MEVHAARAAAANHPEVGHLALGTKFSAIYPDAAPRLVEVHAASAVAAIHPEVGHLVLGTEFSAVYPDATPQPVEGPLRILANPEVCSLSSVREIDIS